MLESLKFWKRKKKKEKVAEKKEEKKIALVDLGERISELKHGQSKIYRQMGDDHEKIMEGQRSVREDLQGLIRQRETLDQKKLKVEEKIKNRITKKVKLRSLPFSELKEELEISKPTLSKWLKSLESEGKIRRKTDPEDKRKKLIKFVK